MHNILTINPALNKRITNWANGLKKSNWDVVVTVTTDPDEVVHIMFDTAYSKNEIHFMLEEALTQLEQSINFEEDEDFVIFSPVNLN